MTHRIPFGLRWLRRQRRALFLTVFAFLFASAFAFLVHSVPMTFG